MTLKPLTPQIGRKLLLQLEEPKRESAIVLDGFRSWDPWDRQRLTSFLEELQARGFVARETPPRRRQNSRRMEGDAAGAGGQDARRFSVAALMHDLEIAMNYARDERLRDTTVLRRTGWPMAYTPSGRISSCPGGHWLLTRC